MTTQTQTTQGQQQAQQPRRDDNMTGALFRSDKRHPKAPDRWGFITINGVKYKLSGWLKVAKGSGKEFLSLTAVLDTTPPVEKPAGAAPHASTRPNVAKPASRPPVGPMAEGEYYVPREHLVSAE
jgi:hypothetical protein